MIEKTRSSPSTTRPVHHEICVLKCVASGILVREMLGLLGWHDAKFGVAADKPLR
jgi:hypothetical protein